MAGRGDGPFAEGGAGMDESGTTLARVYDALLGGKENYETDREVRDQLTAVAPEYSKVAWDNRHFLLRAARFLAGAAGIGQFLEFGACFPVGDSVHDVVQRANRDATVVYVGMDPLVLAHGRALLEDNDHTHIVDIDWRDARNVTGNAEVRKYIDFEQPMAISHVSTLCHVPDECDPWAIMRELVDVAAPGSYVVFAHLLDPGPEHELAELAARAQEVYLTSPIGSGWFRTMDQIMAMLEGLELTEPGMVPIAEWWPDGPPSAPLAPMQRLLVGAVARKP
ncbi:SAM-dependent methyltransferase [Kibdelosporangium banguiense]|uniref:SAM-dependent methyltransferase n=1 Tax=Kibdelosporangium banguiense TaxID=1365924 RepID=A0ABS4TNQ1_9PSEU|nr:SAM-dependent methyltransferase [Kibdelosporangium banguiense]MBP2326031.1 SAM-dependent methyltransferase [Kibdelosporangium banguiense]